MNVDSSLHHVVLDSGGIIKGQTQTYHQLGAKFWTISEVLGEIRDMKARERLELLPVDLEVRTPSEKAMHAVSSFARQTGDFAALSLVDLKVMALSYDLECQMNGQTFLRESPKLPGQEKKVNKAPSPAIITDEVLEKCVPCECSGEDNEHAHTHNHEHSVDAVQQVTSDFASSVTLDTNNKDSVSTPGGEEVSHDEVGGVEVAETEEEQKLDVDVDEDEDEDDEDSEEDEDSKDHQVSFEQLDEEQEPTQSPPNFTAEDFPSLGAPSSRQQMQHDDTLPPPPPAPSSWSKKISSQVLEPATAHSFTPLPSTATHIIPSSSSSSSSGSEGGASSHFEKASTSTSSSSSGPGHVTETETKSKAVPSRILTSGVGSGGYVNAEWNTRQGDEDDGVGWINPSNVGACKNTGQNMLNSQSFENFGLSAGSTSEFKVVSSGKKKRNKKQAADEVQVQRPFNVACMTTDYAMQNVMVQMGLQVISTDCRLIRQVKQWVLRCGACFQVHYDMDRLFCSRCGSNLMQRISASTDSHTGELRLHLKKNYHHNTRGLIHSLPKAGKQKRYDGELLLREDQLMSGIWRQKVVKIRKDVRSAFGEDVTADVGMHVNKGAAIKVGLGRRNPNADKGRERRGKKKK